MKHTSINKHRFYISKKKMFLEFTCVLSNEVGIAAIFNHTSAKIAKSSLLPSLKPTWHLKMDGWKMIHFLSGQKAYGLCSVAFDVSFRECTLRKNQPFQWLKNGICHDTETMFGLFAPKKSVHKGWHGSVYRS